MDRRGNIGMAYSFGGDPHYPGQRFTARRASDPKGGMTFAGVRAGGGPGIAGRELAVGGLHRYRHRSGGWMHVLVRRQLPEVGKREFNDADRVVCRSGM